MAFDIQAIPLSLYIHIPWCVQKCPYCDFNSHAIQKDAQPEKEYVQCLIEDLKQDAHLAQGRKLSSIFIGGGTPSLFSPQSIDHILNAVNHELDFADNIEITLEANPGTFEAAKFADFVSAGVNRISLGVQSFDDKQLTALGRIHNSLEAKRAIDCLHHLSLKSFNLDIMYALPNQTVSMALQDIQTAIAFQPKHFSWYHLTLEPNTVFYNNPPKNIPDENTVIDIETQGRALLNEHGLKQYEVSAYAQDGFASLHNQNYWTFGDYLALGAGAHGKITEADRVIRYTKQRVPTNYLAADKPFTTNIKPVLVDDLPLEFMMNALRLTDGVPLEYFEQRTGLSLLSVETLLKRAIEKELIVVGNHIKTTPLGARFLNDVVGMFS